MPEKLYQSHSLEKTSEGISGSLTLWEDSPVSPVDVGDTFSPVANGPVLIAEKVSIKDNVLGTFNGKLLRQWQITIEGSNNSSGSAETHVKYNFNISAGEKSGSMEVTNTGNHPSITLDIGDTFNVPGIGKVFCSNVKGSDDYDDNGVHVWTVIYEGTDKQQVSASLPETEIATTYEINGATVRTVAGEFVALRRSETPITKKSITLYQETDTAVTSPGATYEGGIVTSVNISKETIKNNGVVTATYYKHQIEVES